MNKLLLSAIGASLITTSVFAGNQARDSWKKWMLEMMGLV